MEEGKISILTSTEGSIMKFNITKPIPTKETPKDSYVVQIKVMQGDADGYRKFTLPPFKKGSEEASLQNLLETLKRMESEFSYETGYKEILGFQQWFGEIRTIDDLPKWFPELLEKFGTETSEEIVTLSQRHRGEWKPDPVYGYNSPEQLDEYKVLYYDETGNKFAVEIDW